MAKKPLPAPEMVRQVLRYDAASGKLYWLPRSREWFASDSRLADIQKRNAWNSRNAGREAFTASDGKGYLQGQVLKYHTMAHRVAWVIAYGEWPGIIDHIDGDGTNNRLLNLREVTKQENARNFPITKANTSGVVGVRQRMPSGRWAAHIGSGETYRHLGTYGCQTAARLARKAAERDIGYHPNHGERPVAFDRSKGEGGQALAAPIR